MSERMVLVVEALGHWVLGWTLVVLAVAVWIRAARPRRAAVRYGGWLLATFAGAVLGPVVLAVGPLASWREVLGVLPTRPTAAEPSDRPTGSRSWFDGAADILPPGIGRGPGGRRRPIRARRSGSPVLLGRRDLREPEGILRHHRIAGWTSRRASGPRASCSSPHVWLVGLAHPVLAGRGRADRARGARRGTRVVASRAGDSSTGADRGAPGYRRADVRRTAPAGHPLADARELPDEPARAAREPDPRAGAPPSWRRRGGPAGRGLAGADLVLPARPPDGVHPAKGARVSLRRPGGREAGDARAIRAMAAGPGPGPGRSDRLPSWPRRSWAGRAWRTASGGSCAASCGGPGRSAAGPGRSWPSRPC